MGSFNLGPRAARPQRARQREEDISQIISFRNNRLSRLEITELVVGAIIIRSSREHRRIVTLPSQKVHQADVLLALARSLRAGRRGPIKRFR
jgi:hypothetical protein